MKPSALVKVLCLAVCVPASLLAAERAGRAPKPADKREAENYLSAAAPPAANPTPAEAADNPADSNAMPPEVASLHEALEGQGDSLFDAFEKVYATSRAVTTCGPDISRLKALQTYYQEMLTRMGVSKEELESLIVAERQRIANSLKELERSHTPGSPEYDRAMVRLVEVVQPYLDQITDKAQNYPQAIEATRAQLAGVTAALAYHTCLFNLMKDSPGEVAALRDVVPAEAPAADQALSPEDIADRALKAQEWLKKQQIPLPSAR